MSRYLFDLSIRDGEIIALTPGECFHVLGAISSAIMHTRRLAENPRARDEDRARWKRRTSALEAVMARLAKADAPVHRRGTSTKRTGAQRRLRNASRAAAASAESDATEMPVDGAWETWADQRQGGAE